EDKSKDKPEAEDSAEDEEESAEGVSAAPEAGGGRVVASPLARRIAQEHGLSLEGVEGSGPGGRIVKSDVEGALAAVASAPAAKQSGAAKAPAAVAASKAAGGEIGMVGQLPDADGTSQPLSQMRKTIAKRLTQVWSATPHFYLTMAIDMEP